MKSDSTTPTRPVPDSAPVVPPQPGPWTRLDWINLVSLVGAALAVRLLYFHLVNQEPWFRVPIVDSFNYDQWARRILGGEWIGKSFFIHSPLYAYVMALVYAVGGAQPVVMAGFQLFGLAPASVALMYLLGRRVASRPVGVMAGLIGAFYGIGIFHEGTLLTVVLIHFLNIATLLAAYRATETQTPRAWLLVGLLLGLSVLSRPTVLVFFPVLALWIWLAVRRSGQPWWQPAWRPWLALGLGMFLLLAPVTLRNVIVLKEFMLSVPHGGPDFYLGNAEKANGYPIPFGDLGLSSVEWVPDFKRAAEQRAGHPMTYGQSSRYWFQKAWEEIHRNPEHWRQVLVDKVLLFINQYEFTTSLDYYSVRSETPILRWPWLHFGLIMPLGLLGMILAWRRWRELLPLYGLVAIYAFTNVAIMVSSEYRYSMLPAVFVFAGMALETVARRLRTRSFQELALPAVGLIIFFILCNLDVVGQETRDYHDATGRSNLGNLYARIKDYPRALEQFDIAKGKIQYKEGHWIWLAQKQANLMMEAGLYEQALLAMQTLYPKASQDTDVLTLYANALTANGRYDEAVKIRKAAIEIRPLSSMLYSNLGITYLWAGNTTEADRAFAKALELDPRREQEIEQSRQRVLQRQQNPGENAPVRSSESSAKDEPIPAGQTPAPPVYQPPVYSPPPIQYQQYQYQQNYQPPPPPVQYQPR